MKDDKNLETSELDGGQNDPLVMQREIKFRVWDGIENEMIYDAQDSYWLGDVIIAINNNELYESRILMQSIGLKDKNGKEIYEGDIVKINGWNGLNVIRYYNEWAGFGLDGSAWKTKYIHSPIDANLNIEFEVVGNIFENPELVA